MSTRLVRVKFIGRSNTSNNNFEIYSNAIIVEFHFSGFDSKYEGMDWESLRLVFEEKDGTWYLIGIIHDQWTTQIDCLKVGTTSPSSKYQ